ncbi:MAG: aldolase/citrate lyase family protein [Candidatus Acidiferrales bacterium]
MNRLQQALQESPRKPLLGVALYFYDPVFLEIAAHLGFDVVWIEMEHAFLTFAQAADLCRMTTGHGMLSMIRIPDARRESILKAAECGPDIIDLPMANSPQQVLDLLRNARFAPLGQRGYFSVSRALRYGLVDSVPDAQQDVNRDLSLMVQVETKESADCIEELCSIPGVDIFIGPADLSASLGVPGQTTHPKVAEVARRLVRVVHEHGKNVAVAVNSTEAEFWIDLGANVLFCTNDISSLKFGAQAALHETEAAITAVARKVNR